MKTENLPKWEDITRDELVEIYRNESKPTIAQMFNISIREVDKKLKMFNIKYYELVNEDFAKKFCKILKEMED